MALVPCREKECGELVSTSAEECPHCGASYPAAAIPSTIHIIQKAPHKGGKMKVHIDGDEKGVLEKKVDSTLTFELSYGQYLLKVKGPIFGTISGQATIKILPAKVYRIEVHANMGLPENKAYFKISMTEAE